MSLSKHYKDMALGQKHVMRMENHSNNPYHQRHIDQFCSYADLVAESAKAEVIEMLPKLIEQYMKSPKWQVDVGFLVSVTLDLTLDDGVGGIVLANLLEMGVFGRHGVFSQLGEGAVHNDFTLCVRELTNILHSNHFPFYWLGEGLGYLLVQNGFTLLVEVGDCGILVEEPGLDFLIGAGFGKCFFSLFGISAKDVELYHDGVVFIVMLGNVVFHVLVGQTLVGRLVALGALAGSDNYYLEAGVVATNFLECLVFVGAILGSSGVEALGNFDGTGGDANSQILHITFSFFFWACCPVVLFCLGCCSLAVITLYRRCRYNLSYYW